VLVKSMMWVSGALTVSAMDRAIEGLYPMWTIILACAGIAAITVAQIADQK